MFKCVAAVLSAVTLAGGCVAGSGSRSASEAPKVYASSPSRASSTARWA
jgi:hypothetical protein